VSRGIPEQLRRLWRRLDTPFALPAANGVEDGTWFELRPDGVRSVGVANPPRFSDQASAEEAARQLRVRRPAFNFVEIITYEMRSGERSDVTIVGRV
jgi:hypothetical protein